MNSLVVYGSRHGNTQKVAEAIAFELGKHGVAQVASAEDARKVLPEQLDLIVVGGPTDAVRLIDAEDGGHLTATVHVFQTAGVPPSNGRLSLPTIG